MARVRAVEESRRQVVECFLARRSRASVDGSVYTTGDTLCVGLYHVAFWHQGTVYLVDHESPHDSVKIVQAMIRLGNHGHRVAEVRVDDGRGSDQSHD